MRIEHIALTCALLGAFCGAPLRLCQAADGHQNTTGLPTYPKSGSQQMDAVYRSIPNGQHCIHFSSSTPDALAAVEDWYKKAMPNAKIEDVNINSLYGSYFKLDGIKLLVGTDMVNVYRMANDKQTSVEIFKCRDAAPPPAR